jgi:hypothetical protein
LCFPELSKQSVRFYGFTFKGWFIHRKERPISSDVKQSLISDAQLYLIVRLQIIIAGVRLEKVGVGLKIAGEEIIFCYRCFKDSRLA